MRSFLLTLGLMAFMGHSLYAQEKWYLNDKFGRLKSKKKASYYAELFKNDSGYHIKVFFYPGIQPYSEGYYKEPDFNSKYRHGKLSYYYPNGQLKSFSTYVHGKQEGPFIHYSTKGVIVREGTYADGLLQGECKEYYSNGQLRYRKFYEHDTLCNAGEQFFSNGKPASLFNYKRGKLHGVVRNFFRDTALISSEVSYEQGKKSGQALYYYNNGNKAALELYKDGSLLQGTYWNEQGVMLDTVLKSMSKEENPSFPGGEELMMDFISTNVVYPITARENGITGRVILSFVVTENGNLEDLDVYASPGFELEEAAMQVVEKFPRWKPGIDHGRAVPVIFSLPIHFQLR